MPKRQIMTTLMLTLSLVVAVAAPGANAGGVVESLLSRTAKPAPVQLTVITGSDNGFVRIRSTRFF